MAFLVSQQPISAYMKKDWVLDLLGAYHNLQSVPEENNFKELTVK